MAEESEKGFTIVELLVSILLTFIIMGAIYSVYRVQTHSAKVQENRMEAQEYARSVLDMMVREIRNVGYFPVGACALPVNTNGIVAASQQSFQFVYDSNAANGCADADEIIAYAYNSGAKNITRASNPGGSTTLESPQDLTDGNATNLQFIYYPQQTGASAPPPYCYPLTSLPSGCVGDVAANLANIQRISISVTVQSKKPDTEFGGQLTVQMTSNADLRNRGLPS